MADDMLWDDELGYWAYIEACEAAEARAGQAHRAMLDAWALRWRHRRDPRLRALAERVGAPMIRPGSPSGIAARRARVLAHALIRAADRVEQGVGNGLEHLVLGAMVALADDLIPPAQRAEWER